MTKFTSVSILIAQKIEIRELIFEKEWLGYRSIAEFVRDAIREKLDRCKLEISSQEKERKRDFY